MTTCIIALFCSIWSLSLIAYLISWKIGVDKTLHDLKTQETMNTKKENYQLNYRIEALRGAIKGFRDHGESKRGTHATIMFELLAEDDAKEGDK